MKIFITGLAKTGRTTIANTLASIEGNHYISAMDWIRAGFRPRAKGEDHLDYERSLADYVSERLKLNYTLVSDNIESIIKSCPSKNYIIDGLVTPQDFIKLFNPTEDIRIVLNRLDNDVDATEQDSIADIAIRDYCSWLSAMNLITKDNWIEYNFRSSGKSGGTIKKMGSRNTVFIVSSLEDVIKHVKELLFPQSANSL